jgi:hypothetical protein
MQSFIPPFIPTQEPAKSHQSEIIVPAHARVIKTPHTELDGITLMEESTEPIAGVDDPVNLLNKDQEFWTPYDVARAVKLALRTVQHHAKKIFKKKYEGTRYKLTWEDACRLVRYVEQVRQEAIRIKTAQQLRNHLAQRSAAAKAANDYNTPRESSTPTYLHG